jgi:hypothetical protein
VTREFDVDEDAVFNVKVHRHFVAAERIESLYLVGGRCRQFTPITRRSVVIENDLAVEVL